MGIKTIEKFYLTKEEAQRILKVKGDLKGATIKGVNSYIFLKEGKEKLEDLEKRLLELRITQNMRNISSFKWYPISVVTIVTLLAMEIFGWDESVIFDIGYKAMSFSRLARVLMRYLADRNLYSGGGQKFFRQQVNIGEIDTIEYDKEKKILITRLKNFNKFHPIIYEYMKGFMLRVTETSLQLKGAKIEQIKSIFRGDPWDEFKITWESIA